MREPEVLNWSGGEHPFLHRIGELLALEKTCDSSVGEIYERLGSTLIGAARWGVRDVTETLRLGLIGGGMDAAEARKSVLTAADMVGLIALAPVALAALHGSLRGPDQDDEAGDEEDPSDVKKKNP